MEIQLPLQKKNARLPSQRDFLSVIDKRGSNHFSSEKSLFKSLQAGHLGEERVLEYLEKFGSQNWKVLRNPWFNHLGNFECDLILFTSAAIKILEIKNYSGTFRYQDGKCFFGNTETSLNPIEQVRGNLADIKQILHRINPLLDISAAVIFTGDDNDVRVQSDSNDIDIINRTQLRNFIQDIAHAEKTHPNPPLNLKKIYHELAKYETTSPYIPKPLTSVEMKEIKSGILCAKCHSQQLKIERFKVSCKCCFVEVREKAILRAICDYSVLNYQRPLTLNEIVNFLKNDASRKLVTRIMREHLLYNKDTKVFNFIS